MGDSCNSGNVYGFIGREVGDISRNLAGRKSNLYVFGIYKIGTAEIDNPYSVFHKSDAFGVYHVLGLRGCRNMKCDIIRGFVYIFKCRCSLNIMIEVPCRLNAEEGVTSDDLHSEMNSRVCNHSAYGAKSDNSECFAHYLNTGKF